MRDPDSVTPEKMDVVGHQAIGVEGVIVAAPVAREPIEIGLVVGVVEKGLSSLVAPNDHVVEQSRDKDSGAARHDAGL